VKAQQLGERGEPDVPTDVVATGLPHDHEVVEPIVSIEEGENETSLTALSDQVGSRFTNSLQTLARCRSIYSSMIPPAIKKDGGIVTICDPVKVVQHEIFQDSNLLYQKYFLLTWKSREHQD
jgi:hypothetical protein